MNRYWALALLLLGALGLSGCNLEGVAGFAPGNDRVAIVSGQTLFTTDIRGGNPVRVSSGGINWTLPVTFDPFGTRVLYSQDDKICISQAATAANPGADCLIPLPSEFRFLSFLPGGEFVLVYQEGATLEMRVYDPAQPAAPIISESGFDHFFVTPNAYKIKRPTSELVEWYLLPYAETNLSWLIIRNRDVSMYRVGATLEGPLPAGQISVAVRDVLRGRDPLDITSTALSPDGSNLVFRTKVGTDPNFTYALYAVNLAQASSPAQRLAGGADFRLEYAFSPDGSELVYESTDGGRSVWIANADGSNPRRLAENASLPEWWD